MSIDETRAVWERFKAADQGHDADGTAAAYAEDVVLKGTPLRGRETMRQLYAAFWAAFPDYRRDIIQEVVTEERIAFTYHYKATQTMDWFGISATGLMLDVTGCSVVSVRDGHFAEVQAFGPDVLGQLRREANVQLVRRLVDAENAGDVDAYAACLAPDVEIWVNGQLTQSSRGAQRESIRATLAAFPDWRRETLSLTCDGELAVLRWRGAGTHSAAWAGMPASGNRVEFHGTSTVEVKDGLMRRIWIDMDMAGPLAHMAGKEQLG